MTVSSAVFVLLCLIWPLSVSGFRSSALISVNDDQTAELLQAELTQAVLSETTDETLAAYVDVIEASGNLRSKQMEYRDYQTMRESLRIGQWESSGGSDFQISYEGSGGPDERQFIELLASRVAARMDSAQGGVAANSRVERFKQAQWIIDQMEDDLDFVMSSLRQLEYGGQDKINGVAGDDSNDRAFHFASSKRVVSPSLGEMATSIASIDIGSLRTVIEGLEADSQQPALPARLGEKASPPRAVGPETIETLPINGVPSLPWLLLIGSFSVLVGSTVAWNYHPFEERGFEKLDCIEKNLEIPVVATLDFKAEVGAETDELKLLQASSFSNRVVRLGGMFLIGVLVVIAGFFVTSIEVRQAFYENPFFGVAKIVRMFAGY